MAKLQNSAHFLAQIRKVEKRKCLFVYIRMEKFGNVAKTAILQTQQIVRQKVKKVGWSSKCPNHAKTTLHPHHSCSQVENARHSIDKILKSGRNGHFEKAKAGQNCQKWPILGRNFKVSKPNENRTVVRRKKTTRKKSKEKTLSLKKRKKTFDESHDCGVYPTKGQELVFITTTCIYSCCAIFAFFFSCSLSHNIQNASIFRCRYTTSPPNLYENL